MHAVCLQWVLDAGSPSVQRWTLVFPASNACRWLTTVLKRRFRFVHRFLCFITSLACCNPNACCPPLCFDFAPCFPSFSVGRPVFRVLHLFRSFAWFSAPLCIAFRLLHRFTRFVVFPAFSAPFSVPVLLYCLHVARTAWFSRRFVLSLASAYRAVMLTT